MVYGFDDKSEESWKESETRVRSYIDEHLNTDEASIQIEGVYRIQGKNSPQPIIVNYSYYKDRQNVLKTYRENLKNTVNQAPDNPTNEDVWKTIRVSEYFPERLIRVRSLKVEY